MITSTSSHPRSRAIPASSADAPALSRRAEGLGPQPMQSFEIRRRRWPGFLAAAAVGGAVAAAVVSSFYDGRSLGQRIDTSVDAAGARVERGVDSARSAANDAAQGAALGAAQAAGRLGAALADTNITAAVKAALATDPSLSALKIEVTTERGVVLLQGPAPDARARERAEVLAAAPPGVVGVDNRLVVRASP